MASGRQGWVLQPPFRPDGGTAWIADLPKELWDDTDSNETPLRSRLRLLEDERELGPGHARHETIRHQGEGRYSFWHDWVYFSTSDGNDPNTNGRTYSIRRGKPALDHRAALRSITPPQYRAPWTAPERPLRCAVLGLGNRGTSLTRLLGGFAGLEIRWLCDASEPRLGQAFDQLDGGVQRTTELATALADPAVDTVFITVPDHLHRAVAEAAFRAGKNVFLEKPVATTAADAKAILAAWQESGRILQLGYVLRGTPFYRAVRNVIRQDRLGPVRVVSLGEQLELLHGASFMRRWHAQSAHSGGLIVHKSCHDLDLACWLLDTRPTRVSSFGGLDTFGRPAPAQFCSQCPERADCVYVDKGLHERRTPAERADPTAFGLDRCVFRADKDIVDNQVVSFELQSGARGTFYLAMQGPLRSERRITLIGDAARLDGVLEDGRFTITYVKPGTEPLVWSANRKSQGGHSGGDEAAVRDFLEACAGRAPPPIKSVSEAMTGLVFALAADRSRRSGAMVALGDDDFELPPG